MIYYRLFNYLLLLLAGAFYGLVFWVRSIKSWEAQAGLASGLSLAFYILAPLVVLNCIVTITLQLKRKCLLDCVVTAFLSLVLLCLFLLS